MNKRYQIFISSTYEDLKVERQSVIKAILKLYHFPIGMEMFHADNEEQWLQIKNTIDMSDYYVLIIGRYCGTLIENEGISYTEKEYNYALSKGIPILRFVISDTAKKESYGVETNKQQKAFSKFVKKVKNFPCEFWNTPDELAYQVASTLSIKFSENNRGGWSPCNVNTINYTSKLEDELVGHYDILYYTALKGMERTLVYSKMKLHKNGEVIFYNNIRGDISSAEYVYHGNCCIDENNIYIYLKNDFSNERATISFIKPTGKLNRFIGLFLATSSNSIPVGIKIACFKEELYLKGINEKLLQNILLSDNVSWSDDILIIEEQQKHLFFSDYILARE